MKRIFSYMLLPLLLLACAQSENKAPVTLKETPAAQYALSMDSAILYTRRYDSVARAHLQGTIPIRSYTIRAADLLQTMGIPMTEKIVYNNIRVYIGIDMKNRFRLLMTPVEGADIDLGKPGSDIILKGKYRSNMVNDESAQAEGEYVFDFTGPCPTSCPQKSRLGPN